MKPRAAVAALLLPAGAVHTAPAHADPCCYPDLPCPAGAQGRNDCTPDERAGERAGEQGVQTQNKDDFLSYVWSNGLRYLSAADVLSAGHSVCGQGGTMPKISHGDTATIIYAAHKWLC